MRIFNRTDNVFTYMPTPQGEGHVRTIPYSNVKGARHRNRTIGVRPFAIICTVENCRKNLKKKMSSSRKYKIYYDIFLSILCRLLALNCFVKIKILNELCTYSRVVRYI